MSDEVDYSKFSREDLEAEIRREEEALATYRRDLVEAEARRADLERATSDERLADLAVRIRLRQERIDRYERALAEFDSQVQRFQERMADRRADIRRIRRSIRREEARLPRLAAVERYITTEVLARLEPLSNRTARMANTKHKIPGLHPWPPHEYKKALSCPARMAGTRNNAPRASGSAACGTG